MALGGRFRGKRSAIVLVHSDRCLCPCGGVWIGDGYWGGGVGMERGQRALQHLFSG